MSVYTAVGRAELAAWLESFAVGDLIDYAGISAGVENSNYFVTTSGGRWVLTLFERLSPGDLDFYLRLMAHLAGRGFPCPRPQADRSGALWRPLAGKPAALVSRLEGSGIDSPTPAHCRAIGEALGRLHKLAADLPAPVPNPRGAVWRRETGERLLPLLPPAEHDLLADELDFQAAQDFESLPQGIVHADLFRDNVLWEPHAHPGSSGAGLAEPARSGGAERGSAKPRPHPLEGEGVRLAGVLDFYFAGEDAFLFDLAVTANDWCSDQESLTALFAGYIGERVLTPAELAAWPAMRRAAALRFWLSRLDDSHHPRPGEVVTVKDPAHFGTMLESLRLAGGNRAG